MKILVFSRSLPCHKTGGMENVAWSVVRGLAERGHRVHIITTSLPKEVCFPLDDALSGLLSIHYVRRARSGEYSRGWWKGSRKAFREFIGEKHPDVIFSISAGARSVLPLSYNVPSIIQLHGTSLGEFYSKLRSRKLLSFISSVMHLINLPKDLFMFHHASLLVGVGPKVCKGLKHPLISPFIDHSKVKMVQNGIDAEQFKPNAKKRAMVRERYGLPLSAKVLVWNSRLNRQKGAHIALEAFRRLHEDNYRLLIVGDGPERKNLERFVLRTGMSDRVIFTGMCSSHSIPELLSAGDAFIFTSLRDEGLPLNLLEAMSCNLPCVVSREVLSTLGSLVDVPGIYPVSPDEEGEIVNSIHRALTSATCGTREVIVGKYSKELMVIRYEKLMQGLIGVMEKE